MKTLFLLIIVISFIGCEKDNSTNHDWYFEIKVDGVPHRIEGSFDDCDFNNRSYINSNGSNESYVTTYGSTFIIGSLNNKGESTYVSGENFSVGLTDVQNLNLGINYFQLLESNSYTESFIGVDCYPFNSQNSTNGLTRFSLTPIDTTLSSVFDKFPINITQYPTPNTNLKNGCYDIGDPIIGSGSSTIYVLDTIDNPLNPWTDRYRYRRPYHIEINFKCYM